MNKRQRVVSSEEPPAVSGQGCNRFGAGADAAEDQVHRAKAVGNEQSCYIVVLAQPSAVVRIEVVADLDTKPAARSRAEGGLGDRLDVRLVSLRKLGIAETHIEFEPRELRRDLCFGK